MKFSKIDVVNKSDNDSFFAIKVILVVKIRNGIEFIIIIA
jgi:hypothetical protein